MPQISISELAVNVSQVSAEKQAERMAAAQALFGLLPPDIDLDQMREERLS